MDSDLEIHVARLDGFLHALSLVSGCIRGYLASAYLLRQGEVSLSIDKLISAEFYPRATFFFDSIRDITSGFGGLGGLEKEIRPYLINNIIGVSDYNFDKNVIADRKSYLSFIIMDLMDPIVKIEPDRSSIKVIELSESSREAETLSVFFCVSISDFFLILQFNDNKLFESKPT